MAGVGKDIPQRLSGSLNAKGQPLDRLTEPSSTTRRPVIIEDIPTDLPGAELPFRTRSGGSALTTGGALVVGAGNAARTRELLAARRSRRAGRGYGPARWLGAGLFGAVVIAVAVSIATGSAQAFAHYGPGFCGRRHTHLVRGTTPPPAGLSAPCCPDHGGGHDHCAPDRPRCCRGLVGAGPSKVAGVASTLVELLAAVPSIVVGLWALLVLQPLFARDVEPFLHGGFLLGLLFGARLRAEHHLPPVVLSVTTCHLGVAAPAPLCERLRWLTARPPWRSAPPAGR